MVCTGISMESHTILYLIPRGAINAEIYINEILAAYVVPHAKLVGADFDLLHDNSPPHADLIVRIYLNNAQKNISGLVETMLGRMNANIQARGINNSFAFYYYICVFVQLG